MRTSLSGSSADRISNVKKACGLLDGLVLIPGQTLSFNDTLGERTEANGWKPATAYANGEVRQEYGGGICQVSSTLYNAVLYANLEIVERACHQFQVGYLPWGMDATIYWGSLDYKFRDVYMLTTAAENEPEVPKRAEAGLTGWIDCYPKSRLAGTLFCGGVNAPRDIAGNGKLQEAYDLGKNI